MTKNVSFAQDCEEKGYLVNKNNVVYAGTHLLIDFNGAINLDSPEKIDEVLKECAIVSGATVLHSYMHKFEPQGVSGVVVLAESHISIHTWPERGYASLDVYMCGEADPYKGLNVLKSFFKPHQVQISEHKRGVIV